MSKDDQIIKRESSVVAKKARHRGRQFTKAVYSARLPFEDARILNAYAKANSLDRSEVVRLGLHQFALRQQMKSHVKNPLLREAQEQLIAEQIAPITNRLDEMTALMNELTNLLIESRQSSKENTPVSIKNAAHLFQEESEFTQLKQQFSEQKKLLERILVTTTLALRLHINYIIQPMLKNMEKGEIETHLRTAEQGRDSWNPTTSEIIKRTGNRILVELNFLKDTSSTDNT